MHTSAIDSVEHAPAREILSILLVEDDQMAAKVVRTVLDRSFGEDGRYYHAQTMAEACEQLERERFDVALLDLNLPDSDADQTLGRFLERASEVPVIVLTGNNCEDVGFQAVQAGAQDFLVKGEYNDKLLVRAIRYARERHRMRTALERLAVMDELTGVYNRRGFQSVVGDMISDRRKTWEGGVFFFFDLDDFKQINDTHGHDSGDVALRLFADVLRQTFRKNAVVARNGGDEFVVFSPGLSRENLQDVLTSFRLLLDKRNEDAGLPFDIQTSVGFSVAEPSGNPKVEDYLAEADRLLYESKREKKALRQ